MSKLVTILMLSICWMCSVKKKRVECVVVVSFVRGVGSISVVQGDAYRRTA